MAKPKTIKNLGSILGGFYQQRNWNRRLELHQVFVFWEQVVGKEIARRALPQEIKKGVLWVNVTDNIWMNQLQFEKYNLLEKINAKLKKISNDPSPDVLIDLRFHLDPYLEKKTKKTKEEVVPPKAIDPDRLARFENAISSLGDPELQETMKRIWMTTESRWDKE